MIILVDERAEVASAYRSSLQREGVCADSFDPEEFSKWFLSTSGPDLSAVEAIVLGDFKDREAVMKSIKSRSELPTIALNDTACAETVVKLFAAGADDVVRKPVQAREIIARVGVIQRRTVSPSRSIEIDGLQIFNDGRDPEANGQVLQLPRRERRILEYLAANRLRRVSRTQVFNAIYGLFDEDIEESVVESHISKLRKKLKVAIGYDPIDTKRFLGYQFCGRAAPAA